VDPTTDPAVLARRQLLLRLGALGASLGIAPSLLRARPAGAGLLSPTGPGASAAALQAAPTADPLTLDTLSGIAAFVAPGDDEYSVHQGVTLAEPGGIAAEAPELVALTLNTYYAVPEVAAFLIEVLTADFSAVPVPGGNLLTWLDGILETDGTLPLAPVVAALVNLLATQVDPSSVTGPFLTPFSRLTWAEKGEVWRRFEGELPNLFTPGVPGTRLPIISSILDLLATLGGLLRFASGAVLEVTAFATYSEYHVFDPATRRLRARPVGWELSDYPPSQPVEGWDEFIGYYQGRTSADA
jgi:hypothetical protein